MAQMENFVFLKKKKWHRGLVHQVIVLKEKKDLNLIIISFIICLKIYLI